MIERDYGELMMKTFCKGVFTVKQDHFEVLAGLLVNINNNINNILGCLGDILKAHGYEIVTSQEEVAHKALEDSLEEN
jgi:hypothetical protein